MPGDNSKEGLFSTLANKNDFGDGNGILSLEGAYSCIVSFTT